MGIQELKRSIRAVSSKRVVHWIGWTLPAWIIAWSTGETVMADLAAIIGVFLMFKWLWRIIGNPLEMFRLLRVGAVFLCALQNISWLVSSFTHQMVLKIPIENSLRENTGGRLGVSEYAAAIIFVTLFAAALAGFGSSRLVFRSERRAFRFMRSLREMPVKHLRWIAIAFITLEVFLITTGVIGQRSIIVEGAKEGEQSLLATIYSGISPFQIAVNAILINYLWGKSFWRFKGLWILFTVSMGILLFLYFNKGRSGFVFCFLAFGYWWAFLKGAKPKLWKLAVISIIIYPVLSQLLLFSNFIRSANSGIENWKGSAIEVIPEAWSRFQSSADNIQEEKTRTASNLALRPLVATPLAMCIQLPAEQKEFMLGENLFNSMVWIIPGPFFPNKSEYPIQELLLYKYFPIGDDDTADSAYLSAYAEFGWPGILIYPAILSLFWLLIIFFIRKLKSSIVISGIIFALMLQLFILNIGEGSVSDWLVTMRTSIFFFIAWNFFIYFILQKKNRSPRMRISSEAA